LKGVVAARLGSRFNLEFKPVDTIILTDQKSVYWYRFQGGVLFKPLVGV